jgi:hypothetical protein
MKKAVLMILFIILMISFCGCVSKPDAPKATLVSPDASFGTAYADMRIGEPHVVRTIQFQQKNVTPEPGYRFVELPYTLTLTNTTKLPEIMIEDGQGNVIESKPVYKGVGCIRETSYFMGVPMSTTTACNSTSFALRTQGNVVSNQSRILAYVMSETFQVPDTDSTKTIRFVFSLPHTAGDTTPYQFAYQADV